MVEVVDLNPHLLNEQWLDYAAFVLFHEYLHVLGYRAHDRTFRSLEARWPNATASGRGKAFTHVRRLARASWHWVSARPVRSAILDKERTWLLHVQALQDGAGRCAQPGH